MNLSSAQDFEKGGGQNPDQIDAPPIHFGATIYNLKNWQL